MAPATGLDLGVLEQTQMVAGGLWSKEGADGGRREQGFSDEAIVSEMLFFTWCGVEDDSHCRRGTLLRAPHASGLAAFLQLLSKTAASVAAGCGRRAITPSCRAGCSGCARCRWSTIRCAQASLSGA